ncbi:MAG: hypothetical protein KatS3mg105_0725 [Gemmatales bacterium]|nr:MAG: hypothetical protein KatS3mg105_0725 [Gemmatales bacterium]
MYRSSLVLAVLLFSGCGLAEYDNLVAVGNVFDSQQASSEKIKNVVRLSLQSLKIGEAASAERRNYLH